MKRKYIYSILKGCCFQNVMRKILESTCILRLECCPIFLFSNKFRRLDKYFKIFMTIEQSKCIMYYQKMYSFYNIRIFTPNQKMSYNMHGIYDYYNLVCIMNDKL